MASVTERVVPALGWLRTYERTWLPKDLLAGVTAGAVVIPQAMAYATVAGLPVEIGLYTCMVPMVVYALLGGSRRMSISTTSTIVALTGVALVSTGAQSQDDLVAAAATLTLMVGVILLIAAVLRLGFLVDAAGEPVVIGLKVGVGLTIAASQLPKLLGIAPPATSGFFQDIGNAIRHLDDANTATVLLSIGTMGGLLALKKWAPRIPGPLIALAVGISLVAFSDIEDHGVAVIQKVPSGLPIPQIPRLDHFSDLLPYAFAIALLAFLESATVARSTRLMTDPTLDNRQEFVAVGAASIAGSFFQTVPAAGGFSQTLVNVNAGAASQVSELVTAGLAVVVALFLAPVLSDLPQATLAAIVLVAISGLIDFKALARVWRIDRVEFTVAAATAIAALVANLLVGVAVGVAMTFYLVLRAINHPVVIELQRPAAGGELERLRDGDTLVPGLLVLRIEGMMYTMNVHNLQTEILRRVAERDPNPQVLLIDVGGTATTSVTVMDVFAEMNGQLEAQGVSLWAAALPSRASTVLQRTPAWQYWSTSGRIHASVSAALAAFEAQREQ